MIKILTSLCVFFALLPLFGCAKEKQDQELKNNSNAKLITSVNTIQSANKFWAKFRNAVLTNDKQAIAIMSQLPLRIVFEEEGTPSNYEYTSFQVIIDVLLHVKDNIPLSSYELIAQNKTLLPEYFTNNGNRFSVGVFVFDRVNDKWIISCASLKEYNDIFVTGPKGTPQQSIQEFWGQFRNAVIVDDYDYIVSTMSFPFETNDTDLDPVATYDNDTHVKHVIVKLLNGSVGKAHKAETMLKYAIKTKILTKYNSRCVGNDFCEIGNFTYRKMMGKWYFVSAARGE
ncbi:MAG: hypothetical protein V2A54_09950 [Bacteroidota bacterium]